jgi:hypothetical protein
MVFQHQLYISTAVHNTDVLLYNAAGDISHVTTKAGIKGVSTYDEVTDL